MEPIYPGTHQVIVIERSGGHEGDCKENILAANPLRLAEGGELRVEIGSDPAVHDIQLVRKCSSIGSFRAGPGRLMILFLSICFCEFPCCYKGLRS